MANLESAQPRLEEKANEFRAGAENAKKYMDEAVSKAKTQAEKTWDDVVETVKRHPGKALGITLVTGLAVGALIASSTRRRRSYASEQLDDFTNQGLDTWERVKSGFADAVCSLKSALDDAGKKVR